MKKDKGSIIEDYKEDSRIGAFEIQLIKKFGMVVRKQIFSKLKTNSWPTISYILKQMSDLMPKCSVTVTLFESAPQLEDPEEDDEV